MSIAIDTNVLIRLLTRDDETQCAAAVKIVQAAVEDGAPVLISTGVLLETEWVLRSRYKLLPAEIQRAFNAILETHEFLAQEPAVLEEALRLWRNQPGADFADCVHIANAVQHARTLATFDQNAARLPGAAIIPMAQHGP
ncbi:type II toxin-antitoxin system VapC family toxin [Allopusillimonas soli]|uniref:Ribonuclease VapC n=1 Tax=Allopusillimonas soli TaxID=659016 RepID=A0A853FB41_9BURK|nr:type II toxin-antitoxin system VapC family toxin [Allopusillimonas soli]NYT37965.1 type II toxin-antitoxin system VapC family toxin [Allopusillimonas soli]TEA73861.1 type II toxin-antitoxin system VapC family toxin [Allopusillimonas soli]